MSRPEETMWEEHPRCRKSICRKDRHRKEIGILEKFKQRLVWLELSDPGNNERPERLESLKNVK